MNPCYGHLPINATVRGTANLRYQPDGWLDYYHTSFGGRVGMRQLAATGETGNPPTITKRHH